MVGFIGISTPSSIFAQEYYDEYESEYSQYYDDYETEDNSYEKYMKDDNHKSISQKINCDNTNINIPSISSNPGIGDEPESTSSSNGDSQSGQRIDRMNGDAFSHQKGDFVYVCQNNNNNNNQIVNVDITNEEQFTPTITACNTIYTAEGDIQNSFNIVDSEVATVCTENTFEQILNANQPIGETDSGVTTSSIANVGQPSVYSQQIKSFQKDNGINIQPKGNLPIDIILSQLSSQSSKTSQPTIPQGTGDSSELTATEKIDKLKTQYMELYQ